MKPDLRQKAIEILNKKGIDNSLLKSSDFETLIEELNIYHIELEQQNHELHEAHVNLEYSKNKYHDLYESVPVGLFTIDKNTNVMESNLKTCTILGTTRQDLIGKSITRFIHPEDQDTFYMRYREVLKQLKQDTCELRMVKKGGGIFYARIKCISNNNALVNISLEEISELHKLSKEKKELQKRFQKISERIPGVVFQYALKPDGTSSFPFASESIKEIYGITPEEVKNDASVVFKRLHPDDYDMVVASIQKSAETMEPWKLEYRTLFDDGTSTWLYGNSIPEKQADETILWHGFITDITQQKLADEKLKEALKQSEKSQKEISLLLEGTSYVLKNEGFEITARKIFDACAKAIGAKAGYVALMSDSGEENELLFLEDGGMKCTVDPSLPMPIRGLREKSYRTGKVAYDNDFMKSGWVKYMPHGHMPLRNVLFSPLNIEGKTVGIMGMACKNGDFDENDARIAAAFGDYAALALQNSRTLKELEDRADELQELNFTKDKLVSIIGHDLSNPLSNIIGFTKLLLEDFKFLPPEKMEKYLKSMNTAANSMSDLLASLLKWSRLQRETTQVNPERIDVSYLTNTSFNLFEAIAEKKLIKLENKIPQGTMVKADPDMIKTVLRNLISNALKFSYEQGEIIVSSEFKDDNCIISVKDKGIGISKTQLPKLFDLKESKSKKGTSGEKGTGLGLILSKEFVEQNQGEIWAESELGKGSKFSFSLPKG